MKKVKTLVKFFGLGAKKKKKKILADKWIWSLEDVDFAALLAALYGKYNPERFNSIDHIIKEYEGEEIFLLRDFCERYSIDYASMQNYIDKARRTKPFAQSVNNNRVAFKDSNNHNESNEFEMLRKAMSGGTNPFTSQTNTQTFNRGETGTFSDPDPDPDPDPTPGPNAIPPPSIQRYRSNNSNSNRPSAADTKSGNKANDGDNGVSQYELDRVREELDHTRKILNKIQLDDAKNNLRFASMNLPTDVDASMFQNQPSLPQSPQPPSSKVMNKNTNTNMNRNAQRNEKNIDGEREALSLDDLASENVRPHGLMLNERQRQKKNFREADEIRKEQRQTQFHGVEKYNSMESFAQTASSGGTKKYISGRGSETESESGIEIGQGYGSMGTGMLARTSPQKAGMATPAVVRAAQLGKLDRASGSSAVGMGSVSTQAYIAASNDQQSVFLADQARTQYPEEFLWHQDRDIIKSTSQANAQVDSNIYSRGEASPRKTLSAKAAVQPRKPSVISAASRSYSEAQARNQKNPIRKSLSDTRSASSVVKIQATKPDKMSNFANATEAHQSYVVHGEEIQNRVLQKEYTQTRDGWGPRRSTTHDPMNTLAPGVLKHSLRGTPDEVDDHLDRLDASDARRQMKLSSHASEYQNVNTSVQGLLELAEYDENRTEDSLRRSQAALLRRVEEQEEKVRHNDDPDRLWVPITDPNTLKTYYYHTKSRETTWIRPSEHLILKTGQESGDVHIEVKAVDEESTDGSERLGTSMNFSYSLKSTSNDADHKYKSSLDSSAGTIRWPESRTRYIPSRRHTSTMLSSSKSSLNDRNLHDQSFALSSPAKSQSQRQPQRANWVMFLDSTTGVNYWFNRRTRVTTWIEPREPYHVHPTALD